MPHEHVLGSCVAFSSKGLHPEYQKFKLTFIFNSTFYAPGTFL